MIMLLCVINDCIVRYNICIYNTAYINIWIQIQTRVQKRTALLVHLEIRQRPRAQHTYIGNLRESMYGRYSAHSVCFENYVAI